MSWVRARHFFLSPPEVTISCPPGLHFPNCIHLSFIITPSAVSHGHRLHVLLSLTIMPRCFLIYLICLFTHLSSLCCCPGLVRFTLFPRCLPGTLSCLLPGFSLFMFLVFPIGGFDLCLFSVIRRKNPSFAFESSPPIHTVTERTNQEKTQQDGLFLFWRSNTSTIPSRPSLEAASLPTERPPIGHLCGGPLWCSPRARAHGGQS